MKPREHLLCSAIGIDGFAIRRRFSVYKTRGCAFKLYDDTGRSHISHGSRKATESDIRDEIMTVYDVGDVTIEGSILHGNISFTWPRKLQHCANCGCEPTRRSYGGRFEGKGYCLFCFPVIRLRENIKNWSKDRPDTWNHSSASLWRWSSSETFEIYRSETNNTAELRLSYLRDTEAKRQGKKLVDSLDVERLRAGLLNGKRRKGALLCDHAFLGEQFCQEQLLIIYNMLAELGESIPWRFPWWDVARRVQDTTHPR